MSTALLGTTFFYKQAEYVIDRVEEFDPTLTALIQNLETNGKDATMYFASRVLSSGKRSDQGAMFYRFTDSGNFVKVL